MEILEILGMIGNVGWFLIFVFFGVIFLIGMVFGDRLSKKREYSLSDLKEDVIYFQETPPIEVFFLRERGSLMRNAYVIDDASRGKIRIVKQENFSGSSSCFWIRKEGDKYCIYPM